MRIPITFNSAASESTISMLESYLGVILPLSFRAFIKRNNGIRLSLPLLIHIMHDHGISRFQFDTLSSVVEILSVRRRKPRYLPVHYMVISQDPYRSALAVHLINGAIYLLENESVSPPNGNLPPSDVGILLFNDISVLLELLERQTPGALCSIDARTLNA